MNFVFLRKYVPKAPISVARLPKMMSQMTHPFIIFEIRHHTNNPGIAAGVKIGRMQSASENLT